MYLKTLGIVTVSGPDAETFLQGQITTDIRLVTAEKASIGALCDAKGRVQVSFLLLRLRAFYFVVPREQVESALKRLKKYAMFSKVSITDETSAWYTSAAPSSQDLFTQTQHESVVTVALPGDKQLLLSQDATALAIYLEKNSLNPLDDHAWQLSNIDAAWPSITPTTSELFTPQMLNLEKMGGVSFNKGCYVGQEIVARTEHLGKLKRHLQVISIAAGTTPCQAGDAITNSVGETVGTLVNVADHHALAVLEDRAVAEELFIHEKTVVLYRGVD